MTFLKSVNFFIKPSTKQTVNRLLRFDNRVVVVTGAGGGLGRECALLFADRGATVVVNDLGEGNNQKVADSVVQEIVNRGGKAVPNYDSVIEGDKIINMALDKFGRIDVLVNNASILKDKSFSEMTDEEYDSVNQVHDFGSFKTANAAWEQFRNQKYGKILNTTCLAGILPNSGQANYSTAKSGLLGLSTTLAVEGAKYNIYTNIIVSLAGTRLIENMVSPELLDAAWKAELIAPVVAWLCHEDCTENGVVIEAAAGFAAKYLWQRSGGAILRNDLSHGVSVESVRDKWAQIADMSTNCDFPLSPGEGMGKFAVALKLQDKGLGESSSVTRLNLTDFIFPVVKHLYRVNDVILYALGLGLHLNDPEGMNYLYENQKDFRVLPTFVVVPAIPCIYEALKFPSLKVDFTKILHGELYVELLRPLQAQAEITMNTQVIDVLEKESGCEYIIKVAGDDDRGPLFTSEIHVFEVGAAKFGGKKVTDKMIARPIATPKREPDAVLEYKTGEEQAALYRLNGDANPLHIDPNSAQRGGFSKPILQRLCTYGIAVRLILKKYAEANPKMFRAAMGKFSDAVVPGETLLVRTWHDGNRIPFEVEVKESGQMVISEGYVDLVPNPKSIEALVEEFM